MDTSVMDIAFIKTGPLKIDMAEIIFETEEIIPEIIIPAKRFGIADLWNIRKNSRHLSIYPNRR